MALNELSEKPLAKKKVVNELLKELKLQNPKFSDEGPCKKSLENCLNDLGVQKQAYHSNSFVGNHCHKILQVFIKYHD